MTWAVRWEATVERHVSWGKVWLRMPWRVMFGSLLYLAPTFFPFEHPEMYRNTGMTVVVASLASWMATQGKRKPRPPLVKEPKGE